MRIVPGAGGDFGCQTLLQPIPAQSRPKLSLLARAWPKARGQPHRCVLGGRKGPAMWQRRRCRQGEYRTLRRKANQARPVYPRGGYRVGLHRWFPVR